MFAKSGFERISWTPIFHESIMRVQDFIGIHRGECVNDFIKWNSSLRLMCLYVTQIYEIQLVCLGTL
jgi:hypothetical protein